MKGTVFQESADQGNQIIQPINTLADDLTDFKQNMVNQAILQIDLSLALGMIVGDLHEINYIIHYLDQCYKHKRAGPISC